MGSEDVKPGLDEVIGGVLARLGERAAAAGVRLDRSLDAGAAGAGPGDPARLAQVLTSLAGTALAAPGPATVTVSAALAGPGGPLRLAVTRDPGPLPAGHERRLDTCRQLVAAMGGELGLDPAPGGGIWFTAALSGHAPAPAQAQAPGAGAGPTVLIVDDSQVNQEVARRALRRMGYEVEVVADGASAVEAVSARPYAVVLMDCQMPGMDGYQATAEIRVREGGARRIPVVAMTASATEADRRRCLDAGMDDFVAKPFDYGALEAVLGRWAGGA